MPTLGGQLDLARCPHCGVARPTLTLVYQQASADFRGVGVGTWGAYKCGSRGKWVVGAASVFNAEIFASYPSSPAVDADLPPKARAFLQQALDSLHAPAGAIMLAASAVDAMLKAKNYLNGTLNDRIDQAVQDGVITKDMSDWAHDVRLDANNQRHADDEAELPTPADAERTIEFAQAFGQFLCALPTRVARGRQAAAAAKK